MRVKLSNLFAIFALVIVCSGVPAASTNESVTLSWTWAPTPEEMGGLPINDYATNVWFQLLSTTNVTTPQTNWTIIADKINAIPWSTQYVAILTLSNSAGPRFFAGRTMTLRDVSPFSNVAPYVHGGGQMLLIIGK